MAIRANRTGRAPVAHPSAPSSTMRLHSVSVAEGYEALASGTDGLTPTEVAHRQSVFGPNDLRVRERDHPVRLLLREFTHLFALVLWVAAGLAAWAAMREPGGGMGVLAWAIVAVVVVNGLFSFWQEYRAERALAALERLLPERVKARRAGRRVDVEASELVPGDLVVLEAGDRVPADCRMVEAVGLRLNVATLTGESMPVSRDAGINPEADPLAATNVALAGTLVVGGRGVGLVLATGPHTEFGRIAHLAQAGLHRASPLQREIARVSRLVALLATGLGVGFFLVGLLLGLPLWVNVLFGVGILVANVPEGLLPTVTLALAMASQRMAGRGAIVRHLPAVEALGAADIICSDKTGTLTRNRMEARRLVLGHDLVAVRPGEVTALGATHRPFFETLLHCEDVPPEVGAHPHEMAGDPLEIALMRLAREALPEVTASPRLDEIPFDSDRRRLVTLHRHPDGPRVHVKGALEAVADHCTTLFIEGAAQPLDAARRRWLEDQESRLAADGLRVLAVATGGGRPGVPLPEQERDLTLLGLVGLEDPPRPETPEAVRRCREAGIRVLMVTGDHPRTALAVARDIGLVPPEADGTLTGADLHQMSDTQLQLALSGPCRVFARISADQKTRIVEALRRRGHVVAVTGDGVNDAPALRAADIGVAMGRSGTDVARAAADLVLTDDDFATIVAAVEEGRAVYANIRKFLTYILSSNVPEIVPYLAFVLLRIPLPLTVVQILAVDLGTDLLPALALGADPPEAEVMKRPPRPPTERLLNRRLLLRAYGILGMYEATAAMAAFFLVLGLGGWTWGAPLAFDAPLHKAATTACLSAIVTAQMANLFACRRDAGPLFRGAAPNRWIALGLASEAVLLLLFIYSPPGQRLLGTAPFPAAVWGLLAALPVGQLAVEALRRARARRPGRAGTAPGADLDRPAAGPPAGDQPAVGDAGP